MSLENWLNIIKKAKKTAIIKDGQRKVHYLFDNGQQMVEDYDMKTNMLTKRAWREKSQLGQDHGWIVEIGDPEPSKINSLEDFKIKKVQMLTTKKLTLEWRIRNLFYPKDVFSVTAEDDTIVIRTSNKKYFKKLKIPDLERIGLKPEQERIEFKHQLNTLIITYKKPPALLQLEKDILEEILSIKTKDDGDVQCPTS